MESLQDLDPADPLEQSPALEALWEAAAGAGVSPRPAQEVGKQELQVAQPFRTFYGSRGERILVGRSAKDNDALTFRVARGRDIWLHARDVSGSHVIIPMEKKASVSSHTLLDAAHLALHFSKARGETSGDVQWTERKHVRRVPGAGPGRVTVAAGRTLRVRVEPERIAALYERKPL